MAQNYTDPPATTAEHSAIETSGTQRTAGRGAYITAIAAFLLLAVVGIAFLLPKLHHRDALVDQVRLDAGPPPVVVAENCLRSTLFQTGTTGDGPGFSANAHLRSDCGLQLRSAMSTSVTMCAPVNCWPRLKTRRHGSP